MNSDSEKAVRDELLGVSVVFCVPVSRLPLSAYARLTGQTLRAVRQQADTGKLLLADAPGKERQVNILYDFLRDIQDANKKLNFNEE